MHMERQDLASWRLKSVRVLFYLNQFVSGPLFIGVTRKIQGRTVSSYAERLACLVNKPASRQFKIRGKERKLDTPASGAFPVCELPVLKLSQ